MRSWWGVGVGSRIVFVFAVDIHPAYFHAVVAAVAGVACADPLLGSRLVDTVQLRWVPVRCRVPFRVPFAENVGCLVTDNLPAASIVAIAGGFAAVPAIAVLVLLGVPAIDVGGPKVDHSYYCSGSVSLFVALAFALGVIVASSWHLFLVLLGPRTPFETAVHSPQLAGLHSGVLPPHCPLILVPSPRSILPALTGGLLGCF